MADFLRSPDRAHPPLLDDVADLAETAFPGEASLRTTLQALCECFAQTPEVVWSDEYHRLFEGPVACPINETAYVRRDKGAILADLCGFYRAFSFEPAIDAGEKPDHLRCELEFLAMLLVMLAQAVERQSEGDQEVTLDALRAFASDHFGEWLAVFSTRLAQVTQLEAYRLLAVGLLEHWRSLVQILDLPDIRVGQHELEEPAEPDDDGSPMECGMANAQASASCELTVEGCHFDAVTTDQVQHAADNSSD